MTFERIYQSCRSFKFDDKTTALMCWNEAYQLGRSRWHWGPAWFVSLCGWVNTQVSRIKNV